MEDTTLKKDHVQKPIWELDFFRKAEENWYWIVLFAFSVFILQGIVNILYMGSWLDEGKYLMKGFWYVTGQVHPYSIEDSTGYVPLFFYELGWWQKFFGIGHYSGRIFSFIIGLINLVTLFIVAREIFQNRFLAAISVMFLASNPIAVKYFCTATPYAIVSLISLLTFYVLLKQNEFNWILSAALAGLGYFLLFFTRSNMVIGIVLFIIFQWSYAKKLKMRRVLVSVGFITILTVWILSIFPVKLSYVAMDFPFLTPLLMKMGILVDPYKLVTENTISALKSSFGLSYLYQSAGALFSAYVIPYFPIVLLSLIGLYAAFKEKLLYKPIGFICIYFLLMSAGHFLGSQSYCIDCILPYSNYFLVFGALASAYAVFYLFREPVSSVKKYFNGLKYGLILIFCIVSFLFYYKSLTYLISNPRNSYVSNVNNLAKQIQMNIPENEKILVIGGSRPYAAQAVFLANRKLELSSINQYHSYYRLKDGLSPDVQQKTIEQLEAMTNWTDLMMNNWIENKYNYIIIDNGYHDEGFKVEDFKPLVEKYFIKTTTLTIPNETFDLFMRKDKEESPKLTAPI